MMRDSLKKKKKKKKKTWYSRAAKARGMEIINGNDSYYNSIKNRIIMGNGFSHSKGWNIVEYCAKAIIMIINSNLAGSWSLLIVKRTGPVSMVLRLYLYRHGIDFHISVHPADQIQFTMARIVYRKQNQGPLFK